MDKNYSFYRGYLKRELAVDGEPGLLAATEVVQAVCDAGFQRNGFSMKSYPSSPHCYFKFAKTPKEGMYKLRAVKKTNMTTLDILIDTRIHPCFVMIEKNTDWQDEKEEVKDTVELGINIGAEIFNWHIDLKEYHADSTEHLEEFISALSYMKDIEDMHEKHNSTVQIGQLILKMNGNNYYNDDMKMKEDEEDELKEERKMKEEEMEEERFHFIHPEIEDDEAWRIHKAIKRLVTNQKVPEICQYLNLLAQNNKILLPQMPSVTYAELVRMGMPTGAGFSEYNLKKYYRG